jgi:hypothetical protein
VPNKAGFYELKTQGRILNSWELKNNTLKFLGLAWYYVLLIVIVLIGLIMIIRNRNESSSLPVGGFSGNIS